MKEEILEADVLCIGGGIAGLMAAIRAAEVGVRVIVADKANTLRSGAGGTGNDHFKCYIPEVHGRDIQPILDIVAHSPVTGEKSQSFVRTWMEKSFDMVKLWDSWGIPMKYNGQWEFAGHGLPGHPLTDLKYAGLEQKPTLTREARKRGVNIFNRIMIFDLISDGSSVNGAIGIDTRDERLITFKAKSIVLGTGRCVRLYPSATPGWMFNRSQSPLTTGDGRIMALRAGAELANVEMPKRWAGNRYFCRAGKASWVGVIRDAEDKPIGSFVTKPDRKIGDPISDIYTGLFEDYTRAGKGPVYMDCRGMSDDDYQYMMHWLINEGNGAIVNYMMDEKIDVRRNSVEFMTYELIGGGGIRYNERAETAVKGLYAAGDEEPGGISVAATFGWIAGENAAKYVQKVTTSDTDSLKMAAHEKTSLLDSLCRRDTGASWQEVNIALNQVMQDYAGPIRSGSMLQAGLSHLRRLKEKAHNTMLAQNQHELMHCLEALNLLDLGELIFIASLERKETRGNFIRSDYPYTNPLMTNKRLICKLQDNKITTEWRKLED